MSKEIQVPETIPGDPQQISINGVDYVLKPGSTITVPDEVAAELERMIEANTHIAPGVEPPWECAGGGSGGSGDAPVLVDLTLRAQREDGSSEVTSYLVTPEGMSIGDLRDLPDNYIVRVYFDGVTLYANQIDFYESFS